MTAIIKASNHLATFSYICKTGCQVQDKNVIPCLLHNFHTFSLQLCIKKHQCVKYVRNYTFYLIMENYC